ncbi:Lcl C-terminal domain-containing protein [Imhoffiella purpurea]|uniref:Lcl C-terminal domain-containing protein n=1 Tax=Imhoffiella purpurea TaxID=1249627 RepID=W9V530_9GAMM|nr:DUF1566 domain-containing protein [Imhoffiella purpurea]EXJ14658.1 hypothetical protein D779_2187 [Imhoffiella purpurea]
MKTSRILLTFYLLANMAVPSAQECREDGSPPIPGARYILVQNGTVIDRGTGLMWRQCSEGTVGIGCTQGHAERLKWKSALERARSSRFAGYSDWRLPNQGELTTLLQNRCYGLRIDGVVFPNTMAARFWTSTPASYYAGSAWTLDFRDGSSGYGTGSDKAYVRLVRDAGACSPAIPGTCLPHEDRLYEPHGSVEELDPTNEIR